MADCRQQRNMSSSKRPSKGSIHSVSMRSLIINILLIAPLTTLIQINCFQPKATGQMDRPYCNPACRVLHFKCLLQSGMSAAAFQMLASDQHALVSIGGSAKHAVIFDTGASLGITFDREDFDGPLTIPDGNLRLGGMAQGLKIEGVGSVNWTF